MTVTLPCRVCGKPVVWHCWRGVLPTERERVCSSCWGKQKEPSDADRDRND